jgi:hypothetical protein
MNVKHIIKQWRNDTKTYIAACGYTSTENIKPHSLEEVTCLECFRITVKRQASEIVAMKKLASRIANLESF